MTPSLLRILLWKEPLYDLMANIFLDLEDRRWPFEMMRNMWSWTWLTKLLKQELKYANLTCVQVYQVRARYNFFSCRVLKKLFKIENIVTPTFSPPDAKGFVFIDTGLIKCSRCLPLRVVLATYFHECLRGHHGWDYQFPLKGRYKASASALKPVCVP